MRKFLIPIINLVNVILVSITFGLGNNHALTSDHMNQNYYQLVWNASDKANIVGIVGFFLFVVAVAVMLFNFLPVKARKITTMVAGAMFIAAGVLFLKTPGSANINPINPELTGSLIAMAVLVIIAGALTLLMTVLDITAKKAE